MNTYRTVRDTRGFEKPMSSQLVWHDAIVMTTVATVVIVIATWNLGTKYCVKPFYIQRLVTQRLVA